MKMERKKRLFKHHNLNELAHSIRTRGQDTDSIRKEGSSSGKNNRVFVDRFCDFLLLMLAEVAKQERISVSKLYDEIENRTSTDVDIFTAITVFLREYYKSTDTSHVQSSIRTQK